MSRLWSSGAELQSITDGVEITTGILTPAIDTSTFRSGLASYRFLRTGAAGQRAIGYQFSSTNATTDFYFRFYFRLATLASQQYIICRTKTTSSALKVSVRINTDGTLELWNEEDSSQIGLDSSALSLNTWYRIELRVNTTTIASTVVDARIDGVSFASGTIDLTAGIAIIDLGGLSVSVDSTFEWHIDDIAINNSSGSFQNSYPGVGEIRHLIPNATGDNGDWTGDNTDIDEITPDDTTTKISSNTGAQLEDVNLAATPAGIGASDIINVVAVGCRFNGAGASSNAGFKLRVKASAAGTTEESAEITPTNTTWITNASASPRNYSLTLYDLPGASTTAWTKTDLDAAQIGVNLSTASTNAAQVSTLWMLVDSTPVVGEVTGAGTTGGAPLFLGD